MITAGAHLEHIMRHLGYSSIAVTMDLYGHLLPTEEDTIAEHPTKCCVILGRNVKSRYPHDRLAPVHARHVSRDRVAAALFLVGAVDTYVDPFEGDETVADHLVEGGEDGFDLVVGVDAFDDDR
jgi:hypothetical protein